MGLDMHINRHEARREITTKEYRDVIVDMESALNKRLDDNSEEIVRLSKVFTDKWKGYMRDENITSKVDVAMIDDYKTEEIQNFLFRFFSPFNYGIKEKKQIEIAKDFLETFAPLKATEEQLRLVERRDELEKVLSSTSTEVAYWRKYHDLNAFILNTFGGGNCESTPLSKEDVVCIRDFIIEGNEDPHQIDEILKDWDENSTYVYLPWW